jgi:hypothetical protein
MPAGQKRSAPSRENSRAKRSKAQPADPSLEAQAVVPALDAQPVAQEAPEIVQPAPEIVQPAPEIVQPAPEIVQPAPEIVQPAPEIVQPAPEIVQEPVAEEPQAKQAPIRFRTTVCMMQIGNRILSRFALPVAPAQPVAPPAQPVQAPQAQPAPPAQPVQAPQAQPEQPELPLVQHAAQPQVVVKTAHAAFWQLPAFWYFMCLLMTYMLCIIVASHLYLVAGSFAAGVSRVMDLWAQAYLPPALVTPATPEAQVERVLQGEILPMSILDGFEFDPEGDFVEY